MGFAVAYYDKRGVGGSTGEYSGIGITNSVDMFNKLSSDARTVAAWLKDEPGIDKNRIGLFGISQAGWIIPQAAAQSSDIKFCIIVSGPVGSVGEENYFSKIAGDEIEDQIYSDDELEKKLREYGGPHGFDSPYGSRRIRRNEIIKKVIPARITPRRCNSAIKRPDICFSSFASGIGNPTP